jgi:hypothetical protein
MNPLEEYLSEKQAAGFFEGLRQGAMHAVGAAIPVGKATPPGAVFSPFRLGGTMAEKAMGGAVAAGGALALTGVGMAVQKVYDAATKSRDFRSMLENNPDLAEKHKESPKLFNQMFSTLRTFNPSFSRDPVVAGSYMRQMVDDPMHAGQAVVEALGHRDKMPSPLSQAFRSGSSKKK